MKTYSSPILLVVMLSALFCLGQKVITVPVTVTEPSHVAYKPSETPSISSPTPAEGCNVQSVTIWDEITVSNQVYLRHQEIILPVTLTVTNRILMEANIPVGFDPSILINHPYAIPWQESFQTAPFTGRSFFRIVIRISQPNYNAFKEFWILNDSNKTLDRAIDPLRGSTSDQD